MCLGVVFTSRGVTTLDGARGKKQAWRPMFEHTVFQEQMHCIEGSTCEWFGARGIMLPSLRPCSRVTEQDDWCTDCRTNAVWRELHHPAIRKRGDFKLRPAANTARVPRTFAEQLRIIISLDLTRPPRLMRPWTVVDARFCLVLHFMSAVALKLRRWSHRRVDVTTAMVQVRDQNDPKKIEKYEMQNI